MFLSPFDPARPNHPFASSLPLGSPLPPSSLFVLTLSFFISADSFCPFTLDRSDSSRTARPSSPSFRRATTGSASPTHSGSVVSSPRHHSPLARLTSAPPPPSLRQPRSWPGSGHSTLSVFMPFSHGECLSGSSPLPPLFPFGPASTHLRRATPRAGLVLLQGVSSLAVLPPRACRTSCVRWAAGPEDARHRETLPFLVSPRGRRPCADTLESSGLLREMGSCDTGVPEICSGVSSGSSPTDLCPLVERQQLS